jgi:5-methylcytosine-specific restriction endonuclease McrA
MTRVAPKTGEAVDVEPRKAFKMADVVAAYGEQGGRCAVCGAPLATFTRDHRVPRALGGRTDRANLQLICPGCDHAKTHGAGDISRVAKAKRQAKMMEPSAPGSMPSRPFPKGRGFKRRTK